MGSNKKFQKKIAEIMIMLKDNERFSIESVLKILYKGMTTADFDNLTAKQKNRDRVYSCEIFKKFREQEAIILVEEIDRGKGRIKERIHVISPNGKKIIQDFLNS